MKFDVYRHVTERIVEEMENGVIPWKETWVLKRDNFNPVSGHDYSGINNWMLNLEKAKQGYRDNRWLTFLQAKERGYRIKKGSKSALVIFWKLVNRNIADVHDAVADVSDEAAKDYDNKNVSSFPILRFYLVFNGDCIDGLPAPEGKEEATEKTSLDNTIETYLKRESIALAYGKPAFYPFLDRITMPDRTDFESPSEYYQAFCHEIIHSTGTKYRLTRHKDNDRYQFGSALGIRAVAAPVTTSLSLARNRIQRKNWLLNWELLTSARNMVFCHRSGIRLPICKAG